MASLQDLQKQFGIPGIVKFAAGANGLPMIGVTSDLASADIYLHGGHITHFQPRGAAPVLFLSKSSYFENARPIRGGVPIIFPWFGGRAGHPDSPAHGFARTMEWTVESCDLRGDGSLRIVLNLASDPTTLKTWPNTFSLRLIAIIAKTLDLTLETKNTSQTPWEFEQAMHTYLSVGDVRRVTITGLAGVEYLDKTDNMARKKQDEPPIQITRETDRVYLHTQSAAVAQDALLNRTITVEKQGSDATVIWNPWVAKAKAMPDFGDDEWPSMLCIETAAVGECAITLPAGSTHRMRAVIRVG
jgi:D-hexose-6-phosphate mutarotase